MIFTAPAIGGEMNKGRHWKLSPETRARMSIAQRGNKKSLGLKQSAESRRKRSLALKGRVFSEEHRARIAAAKRGKKLPAVVCEKMSLARQGAKHPNWKGGITPENQRVRNSREMKAWRDAVFSRDQFTCLDCGQIGGKLEADHIKPFAYFPELRFDISNGRTLCFTCHRTGQGWRLHAR